MLVSAKMPITTRAMVRVPRSFPRALAPRRVPAWPRTGVWGGGAGGEAELGVPGLGEGRGVATDGSVVERPVAGGGHPSWCVERGVGVWPGISALRLDRDRPEDPVSQAKGPADRALELQRTVIGVETSGSPEFESIESLRGGGAGGVNG